MKLILLLIFLISCSSAPVRRTDKLSILQGITGPKEVEFSVVGPKEKTLRFELQTSEGTIVAPDETKVVTKDHSPYAVHKVVFVRDQKTEYNLVVYENNKVIDQRLVGKGQLDVNRLRVAIASCMNENYPQHFKIWDVLASKNPEYLMMIGDNVYADKDGEETIATNPQVLWNRYVDVRLSLPVFFNEKLIPVHALWDDHDYGINDGGEEYEYKEESKDVFEAFFAQSLSEDEFSRGHGVGGLLSLGDFNFYFLDGRSFRAKHSDGRHLGMDQENWLISKLKEETTPSFIVKGDQFFGGYHTWESFEGKHPGNFSGFTDRLRDSKTPFIFISGDAHMSEIMQFPRALFGMPSFEITSSPIHAGTAKDARPKNPWMVVNESHHVNFTLIDNLAQNNHWFLDVESIGENGEVFYRRELAVFIKDLQNNLNEVRKRRHGKRRYRKIRRRR